MVKTPSSVLRNLLSKYPLRWQLILLIIIVFTVLGAILFISFPKLIQSSVFREVQLLRIEPTSSIEPGNPQAQKTPNPVITLDIEGMESVALDLLQIRLQKTIGLTLVGALLIGLLLSILLSKFITTPIEKLSQSISLETKPCTELPGDIMPSQELSDLHAAIMLSLRRFEKQFENQQQFLLDVAHEFRTPVASIRMKVDVDKKKTSVTPADFYSLCATVDRSTARLEQLIMKLKCLSSDQSIIPSNVNVGTLVAETIELLLPLSRDKNIEIQNLTNLNHFLITEPLFIQTIITNIIENSILYNKQGGKVVVSSIQTEEGCEIRVEDNGIGIDKEDLEKIFTRFYRVDKSKSRQTGGSGLGLPIVKALVNRLGGRISIKSELDNGTEVEIFVPDFQENKVA
jgi:signal transduction histidine kinase